MIILIIVTFLRCRKLEDKCKLSIFKILCQNISVVSVFYIIISCATIVRYLFEDFEFAKADAEGFNTVINLIGVAGGFVLVVMLCLVVVLVFVVINTTLWGSYLIAKKVKKNRNEDK